MGIWIKCLKKFKIKKYKDKFFHLPYAPTDFSSKSIEARWWYTLSSILPNSWSFHSFKKYLFGNEQKQSKVENVRIVDIEINA